MRDGPAAGLREIEPLRDEPVLSTYPYLEAARADFLARLGRWDESAAAYEEALLLAGNGVESTFLPTPAGRRTRPPALLSATTAPGTRHTAAASRVARRWA